MSQIVTVRSAADPDKKLDQGLADRRVYRVGSRFLNQAPDSACRICSIGRGYAPCDTVLWETKHFRVVPSKGGFVPGWVMIVPRAHVLSMAGLGDDHLTEFAELVSLVVAKVASRFGGPTLFEHGAFVEQSSFGCGIDHAHVHVVPLPPDIHLRSLAEHVLGEQFKPQVGAPTHAYLRVQAPDEESFFVLEPRVAPPRQFFRQLIWGTGRWNASTYDYDSDPCEDTVRETLGALGGA